MTTNRPLKVFLCHSSNDKPAVRELYQKLRAESWIEPWLDEEELYPGQDWNMEIEKAVEASDAIIVCLTKGSITKEGYVQRELRIVLDYADYKPEGTLYLMPVRLEECEPPRRLRPWQYADYFEGNRERALQRLLVSLKRRADSIGLNTESPAFAGQDFSQTSANTQKPAWLDNEINRLKEKKPIAEVLNTPPAWVKKEGDGISKFISPSQNKITLSNGMELLRVPAGKFIMGEGNEQHSLDIPYDYWMARYPVTNELYSAYVKSKDIKHPVGGWENKKDHPVTHVKWTDVMEYCKWLNETMQVEEFGVQNLQIRLPTEAEWEKAARGTDGRKYPWGNTFNKNRCNSYSFNDGNMFTTPVWLFSPKGDSPYGCADMSGNFGEWTHSVFKKYPYDFYDGRENEDDIKATRIVRGGYANSKPKDVRCAKREPRLWIENVGFRICLAPPLPK